MTEKWIVDDAGTLINMETRENYDYMEEVVDVLNKLSEENEQLKRKVNGLKSELSIWKEDANEHIKETNKLFEENKQLKKELFESEKDYIIETYSDNPTRRDEKIQGLKEEFKQR